MTETVTRTPARNYVDGEWHAAGSGETYEKRNPWRPSEVTGVFQASGTDDAARYVARMQDALAAIPGVESAAATANLLPLRGGGFRSSVGLPGDA